MRRLLFFQKSVKLLDRTMISYQEMGTWDTDEGLEDMIRWAYRDRHRAWQITQRALPHLVCDSVAMEGVNYTAEDVSTIMDGLCVGGQPLIEQQIIYNESLAWRIMLDSVVDDSFSVSKKFICDLRNFIIPNQIPNQFVDLGYLEKNATLASITLSTFDIKSSMENQLWNECMKKYKNILEHANKQGNNVAIYNMVFELFFDLVNAKFFMGGNERLARIMLNGVLIANGLPYMSMTKRRIEYYRDEMDILHGEVGHTNMKTIMLYFIDEHILSKFVPHQSKIQFKSRD